MSGPRLIHLVAAAKSFPRHGASPKVILVPGTISLPTDCRLAVLAGRKVGKTTVLQILAGAVRLDQGAVVGADTLSPVVNAGSLMHPALSAVENLRFLARAYGFDTDGLIMAVEGLGRLDLLLHRPLKSQNGAQRRSLEAATTFVVPFGCYLVDELGQLDPDLVGRCFALAAYRRAGVIFATSQPRLAVQHADAVITIRDGTLHLFGDVREGVEAYEVDRQG